MDTEISARQFAGGDRTPKIQAEFSLSDLTPDALTTTVECPQPVVLKGFKPIRFSLDELTFPVKTFDSAIGETRFEVAKYFCSPLHQRLS